MPDLAFLDTETTSLDWDLGEIWEVGLVLRDSEGDHEYHWMLPVERLAYADPFSLKIGGFHERHPQGIAKFGSKIAAELGTTDLPDFARKFIQLTEGAHLVGMVPSFDEERLRKLVRSVGLIHAWHYHLIDCEALVVGFLHGTTWGATKMAQGVEALAGGQFEVPNAARSLPWDSDELTRAMQLDPDKYERHTALGDARWARDLYDAVMGT